MGFKRPRPLFLSFSAGIGGGEVVGKELCRIYIFSSVMDWLLRLISQQWSFKFEDMSTWYCYTVNL